MSTVRASRVSWSVRTRIIAAIFIVTLFGTATAGITAYLVQHDRVLRDVDVELLHSFEVVRSVVEGGQADSSEDVGGDADAPEGDPPEAEAPDTEATAFDSVDAALAAVLSRVLPGPTESSLGLIDGTPRYISVAETAFHLEDDEALLDRVLQETADGSVRMGTFEGEIGTLRYIAIPIAVGGDDRAALFVTAIDLDAALDEVTAAFETFSWVAGASLVLVFLVGWVVAGRLLRPIRLLRETAARITATDLRERIPVRGNDDVSALTATVNDMLARLEASLDAQGKLLDDVRHELKTPITILRGHLELLDRDDPEDVDATRELLIDELDRMTRLIDDIELLVSTQRMQVQLADVDVTELIEQVFSKCRAISDHAWHLDISGLPGGTIASLDTGRITQALLQLADNAAKYSPARSLIVVGAHRTRHQNADRVGFWVKDEGPGIPEDAHGRIFERLGRADTGRGIAGSGLGLPIVGAIAQSHGGRVLLSSSPQGSTFTIELPLTATED